MSMQNIVEGICLAFLYLRTLSGIRQKARREYFKSNDIFKLFGNLRYNLLRYYIADNYKKIDLIKIVEHYEAWEEKIDKNIVCVLNNKFEKKIGKIISGSGMKYSKELAQHLLKL